MPTPFNVFSDTVIGGALSFLAAPASVAPASLLGITAANVVGGVPLATLQTFLGISGTSGYLAMFGSSNALVNSAAQNTGSGSGSVVEFFGSVKIDYFLTLLSRQAPGSIGANLSVVACDETGMLKFLAAPSMTAGKDYYLSIGTTGFRWVEQTPGGGPVQGITGTGTGGYVMKWQTATAATDSLITSSTTDVSVFGIFNVVPASVTRVRIEDTKFNLHGSVVPAYSGSIAADILFRDTSTGDMRRADASMTRGWLDVYSTGQITALLGNYLSVTGGNMTGKLTMWYANPVISLRHTAGQIASMTADGSSWSLYQTNQSLGGAQNSLMYDLGSGVLYVWQKAGVTWNQYNVATEQWASGSFAAINHIHETVAEISTAALGSGASSTKFLRGDRTWQTISAGGGSVTDVGIGAPTNTFQNGSNVTSTGTLSFSWLNQSHSTFLAGPRRGTAGSPPSATTPNFRALDDVSDVASTALGGGTANSTTMLRGDRQWAAIPTTWMDSIAAPSATTGTAYALTWTGSVWAFIPITGTGTMTALVT